MQLFSFYCHFFARLRAFALAPVLTLALFFATLSNAKAIDEINVAYFLEWPTANQVAQVDKTYDKELGVTVNWREFGNGNEMSSAMASGDVQIAYSQGLVPFVVAVSNGLPLKLVGIAVSYAENDNCVVRSDSGITSKNARELEGKSIATPIGNVTHYKLLRVLDHLQVDTDKVDLVQMNGADAAIAMIRGDVVMGCAFGGPLNRMREVGHDLMSAAEQEAIGIRVFDVISVTEEFANEHPGLVKKFLQVTDKANKRFVTESSQLIPIIAKAAGMDEAATVDMMKGFSFPSSSAQASKAWLNGTVQDFMKEVADFYVSQGQLDKALDDYGTTVDARFLQ